MFLYLEIFTTTYVVFGLKFQHMDMYIYIERERQRERKRQRDTVYTVKHRTEKALELKQYSGNYCES